MKTNIAANVGYERRRYAFAYIFLIPFSSNLFAYRTKRALKMTKLKRFCDYTTPRFGVSRLFIDKSRADFIFQMAKIAE